METVELLDGNRIRRAISIDFMQPRPVDIHGVSLGDEEGRAGVSFVPLMAMVKGPALERFDARDETGSRLPILTLRENGDLATRMLVAALKSDEQAGDISTQVAGIVEEHVQSIVYVVLDDGDGEAFVEGVLGKCTEAERKAFLASSSGRLATLLATSYLLIVRLPGRVGDRRIVHLAFDEEDAPPQTVIRRPGSLRQVLRLTGVGDAGSQHVELVAPAGMEIRWAEGAWGDIGQEISEWAQVPASGPLGDRAHLYFSETTPNSTSWCAFELAIPSRGLIGEGLVLTTSTWALLLVLLTARSVDESFPVNGPLTLLLVAPALIAVYLGRPPAHAYVAHASRIFGRSLTLAAMAPLAAGLGLSLDLSRGWDLMLLSLAVVAASVSSGVFLLARRQGDGGPEIRVRWAIAALGAAVFVLGAGLDGTWSIQMDWGQGAIGTTTLGVLLTLAGAVDGAHWGALPEQEEVQYEHVTTIVQD